MIYNKQCKLHYDGIFEIMVVPTIQSELKTGRTAKRVKNILVRMYRYVRLRISTVMYESTNRDSFADNIDPHDRYPHVCEDQWSSL